MLERSPPSSPRLPATRRAGRYAALRQGLAVVTTASCILLTAHVGRRTTTATLLLFPSAHCLALWVYTRLVVLVSPRLRRQVELTPRSFLVGKGWTSGDVALPAALLALVAVGEAVAVGRLDLELACSLQTLLSAAVLVVAPLVDSANSAALSPVTLAACVGPLLLSVATISSTPTTVPLVCGLSAVVAKAVAWLSLLRSWTAMPGGGLSAFQSLWHSAPIGIVLTSLVAAANLAVHDPLATSLYPPPSLLFFVLASAIVHAVAYSSGLACLHEAAAGDRTGLLKWSTAALPGTVLVLVAARIGGVVLPEFEVSCGAAVIAMLLLAWAHRAETSNGAADAFDPPLVRLSPRGSRTPPGSDSLRSGSPSPRASRDANTRRSATILAGLPFLPFAFLLVQSLVDLPGLPTFSLERVDPYYANRLGLFDRTTSSPSSLPGAPFSPPSMDIVLSHYDSPPSELAEHIAHVKSRGTVKKYRTRTTVYTKGSGGEEPRRALREVEGVDEVVQLENVGREGGTYLHHVLRRFDPPTAEDEAFLGPGRETSHADVTLFLQHHLAWPHVADMRFDHLDDRTGYLHLAPYVRSDCGVDQRVWGNFARMRDLYSMFREDLCPPTMQLAAWAAQFFVSRARIVANPPSKYARVKELLEAPEAHWLLGEGKDFEWGAAMGPSNPFFGHALERSWPVIFNCTDPTMADRCGDDVYDKAACQCRDW